MIIYLHEDIQGCPFMTQQDQIYIVCWSNWYGIHRGTHKCNGGKNQCSQVV